MFERIETPIPGCFELLPRMHRDARGIFVKTFHAASFRALGLQAEFPEDFYSTSKKGVLRGLHFQAPPSAGVKLVCCLAGRAFDAVVDLRVGSPTYGRHACFELAADRPRLLYVPAGLAHGFCALSDDTTLLYKMSHAHDAATDAGIAWNSAGIPWPVSAPLLSERDGRFPALGDFASPFVFAANDH